MNTETMKEIAAVYMEIVSNKKNRPSYSDFIDYNISREKIRLQFGGIEKLHDYMQENYSDFLSENFLALETFFHPDKSAIKSDKKVFIVTTAVADSTAHMGFLSAIDNYCALNDAQVIVMPCESTTNSFEKKTAIFDSVFNDPKYLVVQEDTHLNSNISLCSIQVSAKQIKPISGLSRLGKREGSFVFASPKQFLEFVPSGNKRGTNYSIMTPGACTLPKYYSDTFISKRLSYIAEKDHTIGAIIVEIVDDKLFHFRQIQAAPDGSFIDLATNYSPDGTTKQVNSNIIFGDIHSANVDKFALLSFTQEFKRKLGNIDNIFLHDIFDGYSISHHVTKISERAMRSTKGSSNLIDELKLTHALISDIEHALETENIVIVKSNHDEFLTRYLEEGRYVNDPENHEFSLKLASHLFKDEDILKSAFDELSLDKHQWMFLDRNSSFLIAGIECGSHGDLGLNGAKPSLQTLEKVYGHCVVGHNHSAAIQRGVFRVGTLSKLDMGYNRGPSSWTQTCCLLYENGQRQLINLIGGKISL